MKKWEITYTKELKKGNANTQIINILLENRKITTDKEKELFLQPRDPYSFTPDAVGIDSKQLHIAVQRIQKAIQQKESIIVYADYDADGISAGTILWETLHRLGARVMPYIPHRVEEGYGLSEKGIDNCIERYRPSLIITVDHGITGFEKVAYAKEKGIDVIVTDHHTKPEKLPDCPIVHTAMLCGAGVSWFVAKTLAGDSFSQNRKADLLGIAAIGTIADMMPLIGINRSIVKAGIVGLQTTTRPGLLALYTQSGMTPFSLSVYEVSHIIAPRLNAMGRLVHALDALRLLCTTSKEKAEALASTLTDTNKERQQLTQESTAHAHEIVKEEQHKTKLLFVADEGYNQGIIGLVAGKLVETYYLPSVVVAKGETISKASARSITGFNIVEAIRLAGDLLVDVGGHPMAAGFTVETKHLQKLKEVLTAYAEKTITDDMLKKTLTIDLAIPLPLVSFLLWEEIQTLQPFGFGNTEPTFVSYNLLVADIKVLGKEKKHLKLKLNDTACTASCESIGFGMGQYSELLNIGQLVDVAYTVDVNVWNEKRTLQLKLKDIHIH